MNAETIFTEVLKYDDPAERAKYLDEACGEDTALRAEVESLLAASSDAGSFLEKLPAEMDALLPTRDSGEASNTGSSPADTWRDLLDSSERPDAIGRLGSYDVLELVGRGGMGVVLRAFDPKLNRVVAIKLLAAELTAHATMVQRFLREARAAAAVSHDHVISIYAIGDDARPPMIVMEMVDGQSLQQKIDGTGVLDVRSILRIGMQTAAGLSAAHRQGLVHRDIKPSNIMLENGIERVKLTDFGLARAVDDIGMTQTGQITGTPQYMSPEQAQGQRVDHRTDLFSLGCVLYAMCTGRAAFCADSAVAVMHRVVHDAPPPIRKLNEDIPDWLCDIVDKLLAKNPNDRFQSAEEVADLLGRHLAHLQQPDSVPEPERIAISRRPPDALSENRLDFIEKQLRFSGKMTIVWIALVALLVLLDGTGSLHIGDEEGVFFMVVLGSLPLSFFSGLLVLHAAEHVARKSSYGWSLAGTIASLFPVTPFAAAALPWSVAALWKLQTPQVRAAFGFRRSRSARPQRDDSSYRPDS